MSLFGLVGLVTLTVYATLPFAGRTAAQTETPDRQRFPETGHTVRAPFLDYFNKTGGVNQHGFPITDDYVDRELSPEEMRLVREHLEICQWCAHEAQFETTVLEEVRAKVQRVALPDSLRDRISRALSEVEREQ